MHRGVKTCKPITGVTPTQKTVKRPSLLPLEHTPRFPGHPTQDGKNLFIIVQDTVTFNDNEARLLIESRYGKRIQRHKALAVFTVHRRGTDSCPGSCVWIYSEWCCIRKAFRQIMRVSPSNKHFTHVIQSDVMFRNVCDMTDQPKLLLQAEISHTSSVKLSSVA